MSHRHLQRLLKETFRCFRTECAGLCINREKLILNNKRCDNCCFSTFALAAGRPALICRQKKHFEGSWQIRRLTDSCTNFYPSANYQLRTALALRSNSRPRLIPLTRGKFAVVDSEDYPSLTRFQWFAEYGGKTFYAVRKQNGKSLKMHRWITNAPPHLVVDHIDHNGLNNTRKNLRLCTFAQNTRNATGNAHKTSKYKGVYWNRRIKKWVAVIQFNLKTHHLGYFTDETTAAHAYDKKAKQLHAQFACLNFPE